MGDTDESTTDTQRYSEEDRQGIADSLVPIMLQLVQEDPWIPVRGMMGRLARAGPLRNRGQPLEVFRGGPNFHQTAARREVVRTALARGEADGLPITTEAPEDEWAGYTLPERDGFISWWVSPNRK